MSSSMIGSLVNKALAPLGLALRRNDRALVEAYHRRHRRTAEAALSSLEPSRGRLDRSVARRCDDYAREVLGGREFAPWLHVYATYQGCFKEGWIPDNYYGKVVVPRVKGLYGAAAGGRAFPLCLFADLDPAAVAISSQGKFYDRQLRPVAAQGLAALLFSHHQRVVFKADNSGRGLGIRILDQATFPSSPAPAFPNGVFQPFVEQHPFFSDFSSGAVATVRLTTVVEPFGTPSVRAAYAILPRVTEEHVIASTATKVPIQLDTGCLAGEGLLTPWTVVRRHPDTGAPFAGMTVPSFPQLLGRASALHERFPMAECIGWDFAVDSSGEPVLLEWNGLHNGITLSEATVGPCFTGLGWESLWKEGA